MLNQFVLIICRKCLIHSFRTTIHLFMSDLYPTIVNCNWNHFLPQQIHLYLWSLFTETFVCIIIYWHNLIIFASFYRHKIGQHPNPLCGKFLCRDAFSRSRCYQQTPNWRWNSNESRIWESRKFDFSWTFELRATSNWSSHKLSITKQLIIKLIKSKRSLMWTCLVIRLHNLMNIEVEHEISA